MNEELREMLGGTFGEQFFQLYGDDTIRREGLFRILDQVVIPE